MTEFAPDVPSMVRGDPGRLRQVILNLVGNAIKFTEQGDVVMRVRCAAPRSEASLLHFEVSDSGIGIPRAKLESIFGSFTQVDNSITRRYGGTGLGLAICKRLVEMMGGRIWVDSDEGRGSVFHFEVRLTPVPDVTPKPGAVGQGAPVLVVASQSAGAQALAGVLHGWQFASEICAAHADMAERVMSARAAGRPYYAVVIDPAGAATVDAGLLSLRERGDATPVILLFRPSTVAAGVEKIQYLDSAAYLVKPVKRTQLAAALDALSGPAAVTHRVTAATIMPVTNSARILLVEDNEDNRMLIKAYLRQQPYVVVEAENGAEALDRFKSDTFDLVLMDVQMPIMDGYAATRAIRAWERQVARPRTPVIALTANAVKQDMERSLEAGCDDHLTKPIKKQILLGALRERLSGG